MWLIIPWLIFAGIVAILADGRGRSGFGWFILAVLLSPLVGALLVLVLPNLKVELREREFDRVNSRTCPFCAERIKTEARVCRYCGRDVGPVPGQAVSRSGLSTIVGDGDFAMNVVGESHHQLEIERIAGGRTGNSAHMECVATLVPEPDNPHDPNAVLVTIDGLSVGYLEHNIAPLFNAALQMTGCEGATCSAIIVGGWSRGKTDRGSFGVRLDAFLPFQLRGFRAGAAPPKAVGLRTSLKRVAVAVAIAGSLIALTQIPTGWTPRSKPAEPSSTATEVPFTNTVRTVVIQPSVAPAAQTAAPIVTPPPQPRPAVPQASPVPLPRPRP